MIHLQSVKNLGMISGKRIIIQKNIKGKVKKWLLPVEWVKDEDTDEDVYCVSFPDDLLRVGNLKEGDMIEWVDQGDGSYRLEKVPERYSRSTY
jgi:hypothetical protein